jgi:hypothetical protein
MIVLDLGGVDFIDSSGLGLLVRFMTRTRVAKGHLKLCSVPAKIVDILRVTRLNTIFESYETEGAAIAACRLPATTDGPYRFSTDVLHVDASPDLQHYVREVLAQAGYEVVATSNLHDALILLQATRPKAVVISADLRALTKTDASEAFNSLVNADTVIELPADFWRGDAGAAGGHLIDQVKAIVQMAGV